MKILFGTYPMAFHRMGGGEIQLLQYKKHLAGTEVRVTLFDLWRPEFLRHDVLHFFSCMEGSLWFTQSVANLGIPVVISPNLWITEDRVDDYPFAEIKAQFELARRIVCNSDLECDLLSRVFSVDRWKFVTVYNGVERLFFENVAPQEFRDEFSIDGPFILNVANIEKRKNQLRLVEAAKKIGIKVVTIGNIRDLGYANECFSVGQESFVHIPYLPHDSSLLRSAYAACDLFALPSLLETPGLAALEAAASGAKILVTAEGSAPEYFGDLVAYADPLSVESIVRGIRAAIDMQTGGALRSRILQRFTWDTVIKRLIDVYHSRDVFPRGISLERFYLTDILGSQLVVWSRPKAALLSEKPGLLTFDWRVPQRSLVDVKVNGVVVWPGVEVGTEFSPLTLVLPMDKRGGRPRVEFEVRPQEAVPVTGDPRELGVMVRNVHFIAEEEPGDATLKQRQLQGLGLLFEGLGLQCQGWYRAVEDGSGLHLWSWPRAALLGEKPGLLTFDWRVLQRSLVDVKVNGVVVWPGVEVGTEFSPLTLVLPMDKRGGRPRVEFEVRPQEAVPVTGDPRELGVMVRNVHFIAEEEPGDATLKQRQLQGLGLLFEGLGLQCQGWYRAVEDGSGLHLWSWPRAALLGEKPGLLTFDWRVLQRSLVDVKVNGVVVWPGVEVGTEFSPLTLVLPMDKRGGRPRVEFEVRPQEAVPVTGDPRELGVMVRNVHFIAEEEPGDATLKQRQLQGLGLLFEGLGLQCQGWYRAVEDGSGLHLWSWPRAALLGEKPGLLTFDWRVLQRSLVDVKVNGVVVWPGVEVGTEFSPLTLVLPMDKRGGRPRVEFEVRPTSGIGINGTATDGGKLVLGAHARRVLSQLLSVMGIELDLTPGIQVRNPSFLETGIPVSHGTASDELLSKGFFFESAGLAASGFHKPALDASGWHVWSRNRAEIVLPANRRCRLSFEWRAPQRAEVDVAINGKVFLSKAEIGPEWIAVDWSIEQGSRSIWTKLAIAVRPLGSVDLKGDTRELGVAFRTLSLQPFV